MKRAGQIPVIEHADSTPPELIAKLNQLARDLRVKLPPGVGFTLFLFDYGQDGHLAYISTAEREDMVKVVREWLEKMEKRS